MTFSLPLPTPFSSTLLPADEALWGTFWQGDVIAPGYRLPALELWFLRATWLEKTFDEATPTDFLHTLQSMVMAGPPPVIQRYASGATDLFCLSYPIDDSNVCIWLANDEIIGVYKEFMLDVPPSPYLQAQLSLLPQQLSEWDAAWDTLPLAEKLDCLVWLNRTIGLSPDARVAMWLDSHRAK